MKKKAAHPPKQGAINSCKRTTSERPLILDQIFVIMFAINEISYLPIVWDCWVTMLEVRETDDPVIPVCEATLVKHKQRLKIRTNYVHTVL